jgi:serine/threonine-protein kinase PknG
VCRALSGDLASGAPTLDDLVAASEAWAALPADSPARASLRRDVLAGGLHLLESGAVPADATVSLAGATLVEHDLRASLEQAYRALAKAAASDAERIELIDQANRSRPRTLV